MIQRVNWGILGYARIARLSAIPAILRSPNARLHGVASRDAVKLAECRAHFPQATEMVGYDSYEALLADPAIDAVYIPLPNSLHKPWTMAALRAGKHVLCEKPLALDAAEAGEMIAAARAADRLLMEAFMYRYTDRAKKIAEVVRSGRLGKLRHINASFRFFLDRPNTIKVQPELGGGALYDVGCYPVNLLGLITGRVPQAVHALADMDNGVDVNLSAVLRYDDGLIANIHCGFNAAAYMHATLIGTEGVLECSDTFVDFRGHLTLRDKEGTRLIPVDESDRYAAEFTDFSAAILSGDQPALSLDESLRNMQVLDLIRASLASQPSLNPLNA